MSNLSNRDKKIMWHPFTQEKSAPLPIPIKSGKGAYLYDDQGNHYLDLVSSWWVNLHGHSNVEIAKSIYSQAMELEHVIFAGFTHEPAVQLCESLQKILPKTLSRFFFSDNGSTAVEVSLKMAYQYWYNKGQEQKKIFLSFAGGYHGDTFGAMSVGKDSGFHTRFNNFLFQVLTIPYPATYDGDDQILIKEEQAIQVLQEHLLSHQDSIAALIIEPLIQGASGMKIARPSFINKIIEIVRAHGILVIFDEVMTGFGRTGTHFALDQLEVIPDMLCLSKGITGGFLPLALTIVNDNIFEAFLSDKWDNAFAHGHSYTANPLACAAAITSLKLLTSEFTQKSILSINKTHQEGIAYLLSKGLNIEKTRILGTISAFDLKGQKEISEQLKKEVLQHNLLIRPLGNTIYLLPPYCIKGTELIEAYRKISIILANQ
jgi:adenosylmethionine-8-amino-7-oxononanoate aminotransferase